MMWILVGHLACLALLAELVHRAPVIEGLD